MVAIFLYNIPSRNQNNFMKKNIQGYIQKCVLSFGLALLTATSCSRLSTIDGQNFVQPVVAKIGCDNFKSQIFDSFYLYLDKKDNDLYVSDIENFLQENIQHRFGLDSQASSEIFNQVKTILQIIEKSKYSEMNNSARIRSLISLETGSEKTAELIHAKNLLNQNLLALSQLVDKYDISCAEEKTISPPSFQINSLQQNVKFGAYFTMAHTYQSCEVLRLPDMTKATEDVQGVAKAQKVDSVGWGRKYTDISLIQKTNYYLKNIPDPSPGCTNIKNKPLVYDYGGTPSWDGKNSLNFFVNAGEGGPALGVDCSAFVSSAIAKAGLRYAPGLPNKPIYVRRSSSEFLDPESNQLTCFNRITLDGPQSVQDGDIMAVQGHVVILDHVGADPWGMAQVKTVSECSQLTYKNFDFTVLQSSPSKNSIGINRYKASDYLAESEKMRNGFEKYARQNCINFLTKKKTKPRYTDVSIIRHKMTSECLAPTLVDFQNQSCVASCNFE